MMMRENPFDYVEDKTKKKVDKKGKKVGKKRTGVAK
jgi:hypothetical protein